MPRMFLCLGVFALGVIVNLASANDAQPASSASKRLETIAKARAKGREYLWTCIRPNGAMFSDKYGVFRQGDAQTAFFVSVLSRDPEPSKRSIVRLKVARKFLYRLATQKQGDQPPLTYLSYPVYVSARSIMVMHDYPKKDPAEAFRKVLRAFRYSSDHGWTKKDLAFGGWGFNDEPPVRPEGDVSAIDGPNLSATVEALLAFEIDPKILSEKEKDEVAQFVRRCQNFAGKTEATSDGGFFFSPTDIIRNKADNAPFDKPKKDLTFHSYGSTTADGVLAFLILNMKRDRPRLEKGRDWLITNFDPAKHPGNFEKSRERFRPAYYFYYCQRVAEVFLRLEKNKQLKDSKVKNAKVEQWAELLSMELMKHQRADGSWANKWNDGKEDDPYIATALAVLALDACYESLKKKD